jgi:hypothetical protein
VVVTGRYAPETWRAPLPGDCVGVKVLVFRDERLKQHQARVEAFVLFLQRFDPYP